MRNQLIAYMHAWEQEMSVTEKDGMGKEKTNLGEIGRNGRVLRVCADFRTISFLRHARKEAQHGRCSNCGWRHL